MGLKQDTEHTTFRFGEFQLDTDRGALFRNAVEIPLRPKSFEVLHYLVSHSGVLVSRDDVMSAVWQGVVVTEDSITQCIIEIRKAIGDESRTTIRTLRGRGLRFDATVHVDGKIPGKPRSAGPHQRLFSHRRPSAWSAGAIGLLAVLMVLTAWQTTGVGVLTGEKPRDSAGDVVSAGQDHFLRGAFFHQRRAEGDLDRAIREFELSIAANPQATDARVGLAGSLFVKASTDGRLFEEIAARFNELLSQALAIDATHAEAHARMACYYRLSGNEHLMNYHWEQAIRNGQNNALVLSMAAGEAYRRFELEQAIALQSKSLELKPLSAVNHYNMGWFLFGAERLVEAEAAFNQAVDLNPDFKTGADAMLMRISLLQGRTESARKRALELPPGIDRTMGRAVTSYALGLKNESEQAVRHLTESTEPGAAELLAMVYAFRGSTDRAFASLEQASVEALVSRNPWLIEDFYKRISHSLMLKGLRKDPRWASWDEQFQGFGATRLKLNLAAAD